MMVTVNEWLSHIMGQLAHILRKHLLSPPPFMLILIINHSLKNSLIRVLAFDKGNRASQHCAP